MAWIYLIAAGLFECGWAIGLKYTEGFSRPLPTLLTAAAMLISFILLSNAMKSIPVGTAYAVWTGIGAVGVAVLGVVLFSEALNIFRVGSILLIVAGIAGLKLFSGVSA
jgi:quaternary ammonium compound-resistance protein SugE